MRSPHAVPSFGEHLALKFQNPSHLFEPHVLLELNYADRFQNWFREIVEHFDPAPCEADKCIAGISTLGDRGFALPAE